MQNSKSFRDLVVWQKAKELAIEIYRITDKLPKSETYGLTSQMRRAAISIAANIAESYNRRHPKEKKQLQSVAYASGSELESHIEIANELFGSIDYSKANALLSEVQKILNKFIN
jgi:four helix bundle protein